MANPRNPNYTNDEDDHLCRVYMDVSQDPETGAYQKKKEQFWARVAATYNEEKPIPMMVDRTHRSLESCMQVILPAVSKFKGCIQQIEYLHPSGCSDKDIITRAKKLMTEDPKYPKGFKFDHVWPRMKDFVKYDCTSQRSRLQRFPSQPTEVHDESPTSPDGLSSFSLNLSDGSGCGSGASQRPEGCKKSKLKRKKDEGVYEVLKSIREDNSKIREFIESSTTKRDRDMQIQKEKVAAQKESNAIRKWEADNRILMIDTDKISDPVRCEYFKKEQARIIAKRQEQFHQPTDNTFDMFGGYYPDIGGGSGSDSNIRGSETDFGPY